MVEFDFRALAWPEAPLDAAEHFYSQCLPQVRELLAGEGMWAQMDEDMPALESIGIVFPEAGHEHQGWRLAAVQELAREAAPVRVNGVVGGGDDAVAEVIEYLAAAPGVTGQVLAVAAVNG